MQLGKLRMRTLVLIGVTAAILLTVAACGAAESPSAPQQPAQPAAAAPAQPAVAGSQAARLTDAASAATAQLLPAATVVPAPTPAFIQPGAIPRRAVPTPAAAMVNGAGGFTGLRG